MINNLLITLIGVCSINTAHAFVEDLEVEIHAPIFVKQQKIMELRGGGILVVDESSNFDTSIESSNGTIIWR